MTTFGANAFNRKSRLSSLNTGGGLEPLRVTKARLEAGGSTVQGDQVVSHTPTGVPIYTDIADLRGARRGGTLMDQAGAALGSDVSFLEENVLAPYQKNAQEFRASVDSGAQGIKDATDASMDILGTREKSLDAQAANVNFDTSGVDEQVARGQGQFDQVFQGAERGYQGLHDDVGAFIRNVRGNAREAYDTAMGYGRDAVADSRAAYTGYDARAEDAIRMYVGGMDSRINDQWQLMSAGSIDPNTGQPPSVADKIKFLNASNEQIGRGVLEFRDSAAKKAADLQNVLAQTELGAGQLAIQGGGLLTEAARLELGGLELDRGALADKGQIQLGAAQGASALGMQGEQAKLEAQARAEQYKAAYTEMATGVTQMLSNTRYSGDLASIQYRMAGLGAYADMIKGTPFISLFEGLMAMANIGTAPGGRNLAPVRFG